MYQAVFILTQVLVTVKNIVKIVKFLEFLAKVYLNIAGTVMLFVKTA